MYADDDYYLVNNNKWFAFPNLMVVLSLDNDQTVEISYHIVTETNPQCKLSTRVKIDGQVSKELNGISGNTEFHQISVIGREIELKKGVHVLQLEYKTLGLRKMDGDQDEHVAYLQVKYSQKGHS